jgi:hypothetical protein
LSSVERLIMVRIIVPPISELRNDIISLLGKSKHRAKFGTMGA